MNNTNLAVKELNQESNQSNTSINNVTGINNNEAGKKILDYLQERKRKSESTYKSYNRYFKEFFMFASNKEISQLTWNDIKNISCGQIDEYIAFLLDTGIKPNYVNQKLFACKKLWDKLYHLDRSLDKDMFKFEELDFKKNPYATLNSKEMELLFKFCEESKLKKPLTRKFYFKLLYTVGCRENVASELKWDNFQRREDSQSNVKVWVVSFFEKGKWVEKAVNDDFYNKILTLKGTESLGDKIFDLNIDTLVDTFNSFREQSNLFEINNKIFEETGKKVFEKNGKKVCIHSIKKSGAQRIQNTFNNLNITRIFCQHENLSTTAEVYLDDQSNYLEHGSYMIGKDVSMDMFKDLSKEELLELIEKCGKETQLKMFYKLEEMNRG